MDNKDKLLSKYEKFIIYVLIYTVTFFIFTKTLKYTAPFLIALIIGAFLVKPIKAFCKKFKVNTTVGTILIVTVFYAILITLLTLLIIRLINQTGSLITNITNYIGSNSDDITTWFDNLYNRIEMLFKNMKPEVMEQIKKLFEGFATTLKDILMNFGKSIVNFFVSLIGNLPYISLVLIFSLVCTYFFTMKYVQNPNTLFKYVPVTDEKKEKVHNILHESKNMLFKYIGSFLTVIGITGAISAVAYWILGVPYPLAYGLLTAFLDLLPVLGVSAAYLPMAIYYISQGNYTVPVGLLILYAVVTVGRNIWEPKIMASSLDLSPITTLVAIFVGLQTAGITGMFFLLFLAVGYKILLKVKVLEPLENN